MTDAEFLQYVANAWVGFCYEACYGDEAEVEKAKKEADRLEEIAYRIEGLEK